MCTIGDEYSSRHTARGLGLSLLGFRLIGQQLGADIFADGDVGNVNGNDLEGGTCVESLSKDRSIPAREAATSAWLTMRMFPRASTCACSFSRATGIPALRHHHGIDDDTSRDLSEVHADKVKHLDVTATGDGLKIELSECDEEKNECDNKNNCYGPQEI